MTELKNITFKMCFVFCSNQKREERENKLKKKIVLNELKLMKKIRSFYTHFY